MSKELLVLDDTSNIRKYFPNSAVLTSRLISAVPNAFGATATFTSSGGIHELTLTPVNYGVIVCFDAPNDAVAATWLADTTTNADVLQYVYVPVGTTRTFNFSSAITRWDMLSFDKTALAAGATACWQEVV